MTFCGIDLVHIPRFNNWTHYTDQQLATLFTVNEIAEFKTKGLTQAAFLASRFAVKEACYKAVSSLCAHHAELAIQPFSFRTIAPFIELHKDTQWGVPTIQINHDGFFVKTGITLPLVAYSVSLSHEHEYAIAQVVAEMIF